ncbi:MAG: GNAT family N-acetyltransferase [Henriciella sp.]|nr:GNAT family N-acetyltransferase [Henriciella sp.]
MTFDRWWPDLTRDEEYDPDLLFVVEETNTSHMVGFAQCWTSGFVKDIAVDGAHRRKGVAASLMSQIFATFKARGLRSVSLKVQADNRSGALQLYHAVGMEIA